MATGISIQRRIIAGGLWACAMLGAQQAQAAFGQCAPISGTHGFSFLFSPVLTDPSQNVMGRIIKNADGGNWNLPGSYRVKCECQTRTASYVTAKMLLSEPVFSSGGLTYYALNEYLGVASEVFVAGYRNEYIAAPFANQSNYKTDMDGDDESCASTPYNSGARGRIHLYFRRPFVGVTTIPSTRLVDTYVSVASGVKSDVPVSTISMSGTVTVPQSCEISPQTVTVDFGDILTSKIQTKGAMPPGFTPVERTLTLACRNISAGVKVSLSFRGEADGSMPEALKTSNRNIGVMIKDMQGNVIRPQSGRLPIDNFQYPNQSGSSRISIYPINTTGQPPAVGQFNATATIQAEIQ
ncbi:fimbrial protein [Serratia ureilytica]|uniref:fimbrial protein n=1 Tax=Serratia TaxID=613 RepID=UPI001E5DC24D|nr:fimbrial protein [Serratia ureilytica]